MLAEHWIKFFRKGNNHSFSITIKDKALREKIAAQGYKFKWMDSTFQTDDLNIFIETMNFCYGKKWINERIYVRNYSITGNRYNGMSDCFTVTMEFVNKKMVFYSMKAVFEDKILFNGD